MGEEREDWSWDCCGELTGELTQLAVMGLTTDKSRSGDLGLGVSAALVKVGLVVMGVNVAEEDGCLGVMTAWLLKRTGADGGGG